MWIMWCNKIIEQLAMQKNCAWLWIVYLNKWVHDHTWGTVGNLICCSRNLGFSCSSYASLFYWNASLLERPWREIVSGLSRNSQSLFCQILWLASTSQWLCYCLDHSIHGVHQRLVPVGVTVETGKQIDEIASLKKAYCEDSQAKLVNIWVHV